MKRKKRIIILAVLVVIGGWIYYGNTHVGITEYTYETHKISQYYDGLKIVQISDFHNCSMGDQVVEKVLEVNPDLIVITGDLIDSNRPDPECAYDLLKKLVDISEVIYVKGNHEAWLKDEIKIENTIKNLGVMVLCDSIYYYGDLPNERIGIGGVMDPDFVPNVEPEKVVESGLQLMYLNYNVLNILLSHRPELINTYAKYQVDLALTGHAHGGQFRIPLIGGVVAPNQGLFPKYTSGEYHEGTTTMIVNRGVGNSTIPVRINNTPEIVVVTLKSIQTE